MRELAQCFLKNCTARSCFCAAASDKNVPKFLRFPVLASFLREYSRYSPDCNLRIMRQKRCVLRQAGLDKTTPQNTLRQDGVPRSPMCSALVPGEILRSAAHRRFPQDATVRTA